MKKEEKLKLYLNSLCVYKCIFDQGVGDKFLKLVDNMCQGVSFSGSINAYSDFTYELFMKNENLSLKECIVDAMLLDTNPFNIRLEENTVLPKFLKDGLKSELECLGYITSMNSSDIKEILSEKFNADKVVENRIKTLLDFGLINDKYVAKNKTDYEKLKEKLINNDNWQDYTDNLIEFHMKNGTGRSTAYTAFVWERYDNEDEGRLREIKEPDPVRLKDLIGYESQKQEIIENTENFLKGIPANNLLLYGARGTGKSSTVKAILNEYADEGLRLIEVDKEQLGDFTRIIRLLRYKKQKFIIFVDDLVFAENEASYSALKTILEGRVENRPDNILIYATTNRRHLVQEKFSDREDVNYKDTREEKLSLADRFGITISFLAPNQIEFLQIVKGIVESRNIEIDEKELESEALKWEKWHNGRSPRSAVQFANWLEGNVKNR